MARFIFSVRSTFHYRNKPTLNLVTNSFTPIRMVSASRPINSSYQAQSQNNKTSRNFRFSEKEIHDFHVVFPEMVKQFTNTYVELDTKPAFLTINEVIDYNVLNGNKMRGLFVVKAFKECMGTNKINEENLHLAKVLGWLVEMLETHYLMTNDVMDQYETRRGKLCWYKKVGWKGIADGFIVQFVMFKLLKHYFQDKPYYLNIIELFHEISHLTVLGKSLNAMTSPTAGEFDLNLFTLETYKTIAKYKVALDYFYLPIGLGMFMTGITNQKLHNKAREVGVELGMLFQFQDDYLDCYGDPAAIGKIGNDIDDGKYSWLIVQALQLANAEQKAILKENYGTKDRAGIAKVKAVYDQLQLKSVYKRFEAEQYQKTMKMIDSFDFPVLTNLFTEFTNGMVKQ